MKWHKDTVDAVLVKDLAQRYRLTLQEASILVRRGMTSGKDILFFLESDFNYLYPPFMFLDMEIAVDRIKEAIQNEEKILVYGDKDVDGITSTTIMVRSLRNEGLEVLWNVPQGIVTYGLSKENVDEAYEQGVTLIVTVDCGVSNVEECNYAASLGIDMIVFDHHTPGVALPDAVAIIDAKLLNQNYPFDGLCAAAVAQKFHLAFEFSKTPLYNQDYVLLNIVPLNQTYKFEMLSVRNLVVQWRRTINISPENAAFQLDEFAKNLEGRQIIVFNKESQTRLLSLAVGKVDISCVDLQEEVNKHFTKMKGLSLLQINELVRLPNYLDEELEEVHLLYHLYKSVVYAEMPQLKQVFDEVSDLVAIATIADMMPLIGENRILYKIGLHKLVNSPDPNLACLFKVLNIEIGDSIDSRSIGWSISPVINSSGRMGKADVAVRMLLAETSSEALEYANELKSLNQQRKKQMTDLKAQLKSEVSTSLAQHKTYALIYNNLLPPTFTGIVAGQYSRQYGVPVVIVAKREDAIYSASIRCPALFNAPLLIRELEPHILDGGGHKAAAGFSFVEAQKDTVLAMLHNYLQTKTTDIDTEAHNNIVIDLEIPPKYFNPTDLRHMLKRFEPYGEAWNTIMILFLKINIYSCETVGKSDEHIKFILSIGEYKIAAFIWQYSTNNYNFKELQLAKVVNIVANIKIDYYQGLPQFALIIQGLEIA